MVCHGRSYHNTRFVNPVRKVLVGGDGGGGGCFICFMYIYQVLITLFQLNFSTPKDTEQSLTLL